MANRKAINSVSPIETLPCIKWIVACLNQPLLSSLDCTPLPIVDLSLGRVSKNDNKTELQLHYWHLSKLKCRALWLIAFAIFKKADSTAAVVEDAVQWSSTNLWNANSLFHWIRTTGGDQIIHLIFFSKSRMNRTSRRVSVCGLRLRT